MRAVLIAAVAGLVVSLLAGCGSTPTAPSSEAQLVVTVNTPSAITVSVNNENRGNVNISHLALLVPTHIDITVTVQSMDGLHTTTRTLNLSGDFTLAITF